MGTIYIDEQSIEFEPGQNVLDAALKAGINVPYFCYHPVLGSAGACRLCAMELKSSDSTDDSRIIMSCMQIAQNNQSYRLFHGKADTIRQHMIEYSMTRHPHDCPVCDEAGECHLQDMTILSKHIYRHYTDKKITFLNQDMGPLIWNTANRCITCYRCSRFYQDYALGDDFGVYGSGQKTTFRRCKPGPFNSPFSGNLIDICPTGTFTDKVYRKKYSRTWQLEKNQSLCNHCSVGCNTEPGGRKGTLRRIHPFSHKEINPYFICDRGRYGEHYSETKSRPLTPMLHGKKSDFEKTLTYIRESLEETQGHIGILTSHYADFEAHCALKKLAEHYQGIFSPFLLPQSEERTRYALQKSLSPPSVVQIEKAAGALVIGSLTEAAPMLDLVIRQLIKHKKPVYMIHATPSLLADLIHTSYEEEHVFHSSPQQWADIITQITPSTTLSEKAPHLFSSLASGDSIVLLGVASEMNHAAVLSLHQLQKNLESQDLNASIGFAFEGSNSVGAALISEPHSAQNFISMVDTDKIETLVVCNADPFGYHQAQWKSLQKKIKRLIVIDNVLSPTVEQSHAFLPMTSWSEQSGIAINYEKRLQSFECAYKKSAAISLPYFVSKILSCSLQDLCCQRDTLISKWTHQIPVSNKKDVLIDLDYFPVYSETITPKNSKNTLQLLPLLWHGGGEKADFADDLSQLNPWKNNVVYLHPETAKELDICEKDQLLFPSNVTLPLIIHQKIAPACLAMTHNTLCSINYSPYTDINKDVVSVRKEQ